MAKVLKGLTEEHYLQVKEDDLMDLNMGNIGTCFLRWDIVLAILLMESVDKSTGKEKVGEKTKPSRRSLAKELDPKEEKMTDQQEASLALVCLREEPPMVDVEETMEGEDVEYKIRELLIRTLHPIVVDGEEFLFLDDITHSLEMHQDEALSVLAVYAGLHGTTNPTQDVEIQLDFSSAPTTRMLALPEAHNSMDSLVSAALMSIEENKEAYEMVPESSFAPHQRLTCSDHKNLGSIDITNKNLSEEDDAS